jgi:hypothetical protein
MPPALTKSPQHPPLQPQNSRKQSFCLLQIQCREGFHFAQYQSLLNAAQNAFHNGRLYQTCRPITQEGIVGLASDDIGRPPSDCDRCIPQGVELACCSFPVRIPDTKYCGAA